MRRIHALLLLSILCGQSACAFNPPTDTQGALTVAIADPGEVGALEKTVAVPVTLTNSGDTPLSGNLKVWVTDEWRVGNVGREMTQPFSLPAKGNKTFPLEVIAGKGTYAALYPVHAQATINGGPAPHAILILSVAPKAVEANAPPKVWPTLNVSRTLRLDTPNNYRVSYALQGENPQALPIGFQGSDTTTGTTVILQDINRGERRHALAIHPPWRQGWGDAYVDYKVTLPNQKPLALDFATAIRDSNANEPLSDGVDFRVLADDGTGFKELFSRFSAAKKWEPGRADLSPYAGKTITLRLFTGPGPAHNTSVDQAYWSQPIIIAGTPTPSESAASKAARQAQAINIARQALKGKPALGSWLLNSEAGNTGVAVVAGPNGLIDAAIAFADEQRALVFDGFTIEVDGQPVGVEQIKWAAILGEGGVGVTHISRTTLKPITQMVIASLWGQKGALRIAFSMPNVKRDAKGSPRFTKLGIGPCSEVATRIYAGFGNVLQTPGALDISAGGFNLSTRHVGADFANGLSLVQATDIFPDAYSVNPATKRCTLYAHHDTTFTFVPSSKGAFAAARVFKQIAGYQPAGGVAKLQGKMCLDQWGGDYRTAAQDIEKAAAYGLSDAIFVKHVWQRWGYDYRLPDIYPPAGNQEDFQAMVAACKKTGILFAPHDNYIDFYPDATGFSYDHIIFNADGTPQKAWFNEGRGALSYRWLPTAFAPWQEKNLKMMKDGFAPDGLFVDVFTAIAPIDFYDRAGNFYPKTVTQQKWGESFDIARRIFGNNAPQLSEAGTDALIGHLDGAQSDHSGWVAPGTPRGQGNDADFRWQLPAADGERVPWHDMATHGSFVLLAGGLGNRYAGGQDTFLHGYGSDDYLSLTVLGGRNPMCDGPFNRRAVMTYWLLHDVSAKLAKSEMLTHQFAGDDIHRQSVTFQGANVQANRGKSDWKIGDTVLPPYGFIAQAGESEASIARRDGVITGFARTPGVLFADARPPSLDGGAVRPHVRGVDANGRKIRVRVEWEVLQPVAPLYRPFMHFVNPKGTGGESIAFQGGTAFDGQNLTKPGTFETTFEATLPDTITTTDEFALRFGMYDPTSGGRLGLVGPNENGRARGGKIMVAFKDGQPSIIYQAEAPDPANAEREARLNTTGKIVNFGAVSTNGAFRLEHANVNNWKLTPLPGSGPFDVTLNLRDLKQAKKVASISSVDISGAVGPSLLFTENAANLTFKTGSAFAYRIQFAQ